MSPMTPTPDEMRAFRAERGWTQADFAEQLWVKKRTVEDWEAGRRTHIPLLRLAMFFIRERESLEKQVALMTKETVRVHANGEDITDQQIAEAKARIDEYNRILGQGGNDLES